MARILPLVGVLESTPFYHRAWLFEPVFFLPGTEGTTACAVIPPSPSLCQAGMGGSVSSCWQKSSYSEWSHPLSVGHLVCNALTQIKDYGIQHLPIHNILNEKSLLHTLEY